MEDLVCLSPIDGREVARRSVHSEEVVDRAIAAARRAQREWAEVPLAERCKIVLRFLSALAAANDVIVPELAWQMGRPVRYGGELRSLTERVEAFVAMAEGALASATHPADAGLHRSVRRAPLGLVMVIAPWNYPYLTAINAVVPALLAGNAVLLKHAEQSLLAGERLAEAFQASGLPSGLFANLYLTHEQVGRLLGSGLVDHATFTGSVEGGRAIERAAAGRFTSLTLELGGKDAAYVRADADFDAAVAGLVDGALFNSGQSCCGVERIYVAQPLYSRFVDSFVAAVERYRLGDPLDPSNDLGPMSSARLAARIRGQIEEAVAGGALRCVDGRCFADSPHGPAYLAPEVLTGVDHRMTVMREETFGPVVGIMPVADDDAAVRLMNDSDFGLTASIWTADIDVAAKLGARISAGTIFANRCDYLDPALAWTGTGLSGRGASLGRYGFEAVTRPQSFHLRA